MKRYEVEVWELVRSVVHVEATTGKEAAAKARNDIRPSGVLRRTVKRVRLEA